MKTTARNQYTGTITSVDAGPVTAEVTMTLSGGQTLTATLTSSAAGRMKLVAGKQALALIKASAVVLVTDFAGYRLSARNQFEGTIARIDRGAVSSLVVLDMAGGLSVSATVTHEAVDELALAVGQPATAVFKAYAVMLAVATA